MRGWLSGQHQVAWSEGTREGVVTFWLIPMVVDRACSCRLFTSRTILPAFTFQPRYFSSSGRVEESQQSSQLSYRRALQIFLSKWISQPCIHVPTSLSYSGRVPNVCFWQVLWSFVFVKSNFTFFLTQAESLLLSFPQVRGRVNVSFGFGLPKSLRPLPSQWAKNYCFQASLQARSNQALQVFCVSIFMTLQWTMFVLSKL